ncbi:MAG TPA: polyprenyl synthetase family protein [Polyangiaceae bacterium]|nr:polyprenyl synthetase family protein [Polyangiaceae bacterium]
MTLQAATSVLADTAQATLAGPRAMDRLEAIQSLLSDDLRWIEESLRQVCDDGPAPAVQAAQHLVSRGGKRVRPLSMLLSAACFRPPSDVVRELAVVSELVHSATLLHDDVVDEGDERRGAMAARLVWGNAVSVLGGDLLLVHALERTARLAPELMGDLIATLRRLVDGEIVQLRGRNELDVSETTYERILRDKTASLFAWSTRTGAHLSGASRSDQDRLSVFGERLGLAFQLVDDVLDYSGDASGKSLLTDLREGKLTLPLVLTVAKVPELIGPLKRIYAGDREPVTLVSRAVQECGALDEVRRRATHHTHEAVRSLEAVQPSPARRVLEQVASELARRAA